jgi:hypothetical protein
MGVKPSVAAGNRSRQKCTNLADANLSGANMNNADLTGVDPSGADVAGANFNDVTWSNTTYHDGTNSDADGRTCTGHLRAVLVQLAAGVATSRAAAFSNSTSASLWAEPRWSISREPRREEYTICTALAPEDVFTVRAYGSPAHTTARSP